RTVRRTVRGRGGAAGLRSRLSQRSDTVVHSALRRVSGGPRRRLCQRGRRQKIETETDRSADSKPHRPPAFASGVPSSLESLRGVGRRRRSMLKLRAVKSETPAVPDGLTTPFDRIGGEEAVRALAERFYDVMEAEEPELTG